MSKETNRKDSMDTAVYTHNEKGQRIDVHRPSAINPGDYEYQHVNCNRKHKIKGGPAGTCHHCGKAIVWEFHWLHKPSGNLVTFGVDCTEIMGLSNDRIQHELVLLKRAVENERQKLMREMEQEERAAQFKAQEPEVYDFLANIDEEFEKFYFLVDLKHSMEKWGSLTPRQIDATKNMMKKREEYYARRMAEAMEPEPTTDLEEGRREVVGIVKSHKWQESMYGNVHKMLVKQDDGNKVWVTVPREIDHDGSDLAGLRVSFVAMVERSDKDSHFGFGKRPSKAKVL
jgi:hypothetical protein